jgi:large subunit ribosomal protein L10
VERNKKIEIVEQLKKELEDVNTIFLCNFKGLTVEKDTQLRKQMRDSGTEYRVIKNTLLKIAFADTDFSKVNDSLVGNTALAYNKEDVISVAKLIRDFSKDNPTFEFKVGVVEGRVIDLGELTQLAELPPKEVLISKMMYMLNFPIQGLATALAGVSRNLVVVLDQVRQQKEQG